MVLFVYLCFPFLFIFLFTDITPSIVGATSRYPFADGWTLYLHIWSTFSCHTSSTFRRLDITNQICTKSWCWYIRMPGNNHSLYQKYHQKPFLDCFHLFWFYLFFVWTCVFSILFSSTTIHSWTYELLIKWLFLY